MSMRRMGLAALAAILLIEGIAVLGVLGCRGAADTAAQVVGGDPEHGQGAIKKYGCNACHVIPGIPGANGQVGPSLEGIGGRVYLAGQLPNTPENLMKWVEDPQGIRPGTAMPDMGVTEEDARDITAYLYTLR
jgi:cytochrome c